MWLVCLPIRVPRPLARGRGLFHADLGHAQFVNVGTEVVFGIGDRRVERLLDENGGTLLREREDVEGLVHGLTANEVSHQAALLSRKAHTANDCSSFHLHYPFTFLSAPAAWPWNVRVSANSPSLWPTMFSLT